MSRGTSTMRSYIGRRSARHGTSATRRASTSSAPTTKLRSTSTHAPRVRVVRSAPSSGRTPGDVATAPPKRSLWKSMEAVYAEIEQMFERTLRVVSRLGPGGPHTSTSEEVRWLRCEERQRRASKPRTQGRLGGDPGGARLDGVARLCA